jgi:hypothetical protein
MSKTIAPAGPGLRSEISIEHIERGESDDNAHARLPDEIEYRAISPVRLLPAFVHAHRSLGRRLHNPLPRRALTNTATIPNVPAGRGLQL